MSLDVLLPADLDAGSWASAWLQAAALFAGTFASEDLTSISAGFLIRAGRLNGFVAVFGCFLGIWVSDLGLWLTGRLLGRRLRLRAAAQLGRWFERHDAAAVFASRFLPGSRVPLYLAAGALGRKGGRFALWTFLSALVWTPLLVLGVTVFGETIVGPLQSFLGTGWLTLVLAALGLFVLLRVIVLASTPIGRAKLAARVVRLWRWEFWPTWLFYLPVLPYLVYLAVRYRGLMTWTAANPGIPQGGVVGESKYAILEQLPPESVVPSLLMPPGDPWVRLGQIRRAVEQKDWSFPLILKPDAAQRGAGVKLARDFVDVAKYVEANPAAVLVQTYHPGPYEAGVFWYCLPGEPTGRVFSITDKHFPKLVGDGRSTLEELIWRHPRYHMQAHVFLQRHGAERDLVLSRGEELSLAIAGNHCQGTMFRDGSHLWTPELERAIDAVARQLPGFYIGRFDIRYRSVEDFRAGRDLAIVELNGATSESTNIYDPSWSLLAAYRTLFRQWALLFRIGRANRERGYPATPVLEVLRLVRDYYRHLRVDPLAD
jgi:membrane protein DedA with SNARE-associated domain